MAAMTAADYNPIQNPVSSIQWNGSVDRADFPATFQYYIDGGILRFRNDPDGKGGLVTVAVIKTNVGERIAFLDDIIVVDGTGVNGAPLDPTHPGLLVFSPDLFLNVYEPA